METSLVSETLSDGSVAYNVVFIDGSNKVVIAAVDLKGAQKIQDAFAMYVAHAQVDPA
jgi:hypothetical protein